METYCKRHLTYVQSVTCHDDCGLGRPEYIIPRADFSIPNFPIFPMQYFPGIVEGKAACCARTHARQNFPKLPEIFSFP